MAYWKVSKGLERSIGELEIEGESRPSKTTAMLRSQAEYWADLLSLRLYWTITSVSWCEKLAGREKIAQKEYKTRHGKNWEMCKKFKFYHTNKWYMHNPALVLKDNTHKLLWDFDIHTDHLISARKPDLIIINEKKKKKKKRTCKIVDFVVPADHRIKLKECEKKDKYLNLARELKKLWNMQVTILPIVIGAFGTVT